jgi:hypothetical protein
MDNQWTSYNIKRKRTSDHVCAMHIWESEKDDRIHRDIHTLEAKRDEFWEIGTPCVPNCVTVCPISKTTKSWWVFWCLS